MQKWNMYSKGPSIYYVRTEGEGGRSVRIGILRTGAYGGEGRGSRQMRTYASRLMRVYYKLLPFYRPL